MSKRDIEDPYHELEYSEDDQKDYMGNNQYREKHFVKRTENTFFQLDQDLSGRDTLPSSNERPDSPILSQQSK